MNNMLRKRLIIRKMKRRIKRASRKCIQVKDLVYKRRNIRDSVDYDSPRMQELAQSMKEFGFSPGKAILVNTVKDVDGTVHIRQHHRQPLIGNDLLDLWNFYVK
jgi:hypothetical protein